MLEIAILIVGSVLAWTCPGLALFCCALASPKRLILAIVLWIGLSCGLFSLFPSLTEFGPGEAIGLIVIVLCCELSGLRGGINRVYLAIWAVLAGFCIAGIADHYLRQELGGYRIGLGEVSIFVGLLVHIVLSLRKKPSDLEIKKIAAYLMFQKPEELRRYLLDEPSLQDALNAAADADGEIYSTDCLAAAFKALEQDKWTWTELADFWNDMIDRRDDWLYESRPTALYYRADQNS